MNIKGFLLGSVLVLPLLGGAQAAGPDPLYCFCNQAQILESMRTFCNTTANGDGETTGGGEIQGVWKKAFIRPALPVLDMFGDYEFAGLDDLLPATSTGGLSCIDDGTGLNTCAKDWQDPYMCMGIKFVPAN